MSVCGERRVCACPREMVDRVKQMPARVACPSQPDGDHVMCALAARFTAFWCFLSFFWSRGAQRTRKQHPERVKNSRFARVPRKALQHECYTLTRTIRMGTRWCIKMKRLVIEIAHYSVCEIIRKIVAERLKRSAGVLGGNLLGETIL